MSHAHPILSPVVGHKSRAKARAHRGSAGTNKYTEGYHTCLSRMFGSCDQEMISLENSPLKYSKKVLQHYLTHEDSL